MRFRQRHNPYSQLAELRHSRNELLTLIVVTVLLGILLGLISNAIYELLQAWLSSVPVQEWLPWIANLKHLNRWLILSMSSILGLLIIFWLVQKLYAKTQTDRVRMEVALPYLLHKNEIELVDINQGLPKGAPKYLAGTWAVDSFRKLYPSDSQANREVAEKWRQRITHSDGPPQRTIKTPHGELTTALILFALHDQSKKLLGRDARFGWLQTNLQTDEITFDELPPLLRDNEFVQRRFGRNKNWKMKVPRGVRCQAEVKDGLRIITLLNKDGDGLVIRRYPNFWVETWDSTAGQTLAGHITPPPEKKYFYVMGSRIEAYAVFHYALPPFDDPFEEWASGLLTLLENALDVSDYLEQRTKFMQARRTPEMNA